MANLGTCPVFSSPVTTCPAMLHSARQIAKIAQTAPIAAPATGAMLAIRPTAWSID